jgi:hypothetical protein
MSRAAKKITVESVLDKVKMPILGLYPSGSKVITAEQITLLKARLSNLRIVELPMPYHMIWALAPATCADLILHFIAAHDGIACRE